MPTDPNNERYVHDFADGEYGWGEGTDTKDGYQDIIDQLEHDVPVVAPESEIEQYRALPGRRFVAEDTAREYIGDGSAWVQVASRGPHPTFESAEVNGPLRSGEVLPKQIGSTYHAAQHDGANGGKQIQAAVDVADATAGHNTVVVAGHGPDDLSGTTGVLSNRASTAWEITSPVELPSNTTLILLDCYIFLAAGTDDNIIRNQNVATKDGDTNINIIGLGSAVVDGNASNQTTFTRENAGAEKNLGIRLHPIDDATVKGFTVRNTNAWGVKLEDVTDSTVENLRFDMDGSTPNQDGVDIVGPVQEVTVRNIRGVTGDDMVACRTTGEDKMNEGSGGDIHGYTVDDIKGDTTGSYRLVRGPHNFDGTYNVRNIEISNIHVPPSSNVGQAVGIFPNTQGVFERIRVSDVISNGSEGVRFSGSSVDRLTIESVDVDSADCVRLSLGDKNDKSYNINISDIQKNAATATSAISVKSGEINASTWTDINMSTDGKSAIFVAKDAAVNNIEISDVTYRAKSGDVLLVKGTATDISFSNANVYTADSIINVTGSATGDVSDITATEANITTLFPATDNLRFNGNLPTFDSAPALVAGSEVTASSAWDPDGDGNGEKVISDGLSWIEIADMPNI